MIQNINTTKPRLETPGTELVAHLVTADLKIHKSVLT